MKTEAAVAELMDAAFKQFGGHGPAGARVIRPMQTTFDFERAEQAKERGMSQAATNKASLLEYARGLARAIAREKGEITADDVQRELESRGISVRALGNAAGSLFRGKEWIATGRYVKSERIHAHANRLTVWRLKDAA